MFNIQRDKKIHIIKNGKYFKDKQANVLNTSLICNFVNIDLSEVNSVRNFPCFFKVSITNIFITF